MTERRQKLGLTLAYCALAAVGAFSAYYQLFSQFAAYDDSGHLSASLIKFLAGGDLYDKVYSQYGPFYFEFYGAFFKLTGVEVTTNSVRLIVLVYWVAIGVGTGVMTGRATGNHLLGLLTSVVAFASLGFLAPEPIHPLSLTLIVVLGAIGAVLLPAEPRPRRVAVWLGALIGALAMIKINMGALGAVAVIAAALLTLGPERDARRRRFAAIALIWAAMAVLLSTRIGDQWVQEMLVLFGSATAAITVAAGRVRRDDAPDFALVPFIARAGTAAAMVVVVIAAVMIGLGTGPSDLIDGVLIEPTSHPDIDVFEFFLFDMVAVWSLATVAVAFVSAGRAPLSNLLARSAIRGALAIAIWLSVAGVSPVASSPGSGSVAIGVLAAWLAAVAPGILRESRGRAFARMTAVLLAVLEVLQAYPTAGNQIFAGSFPLILVGALLAADALALARLWSTRTTDRQLLNAGRAAAVLLVALLGMNIFVVGVARPLRSAHSAWAANRPLRVHGAGLLHLRPQIATGYERLIAQTKDCDPLLTYPGMYSLNIWANRPFADGNNVADWMLLVSPDRQRDTIAQIRDKPNLCVIRNDTLIRFHFSRSKAPDHRLPLVDYLNSLPLKDVAVADGASFGAIRLQKRAAP